ncbi:MAG: porin [Verrucomicrobia bacterium]|jgi:phosphate-selective porin OprO and OprP|nr:porin [Verrucomicrobiota bacterium]MBT7068132.1 porin [Verrucomicrobiota bacterium]MBT7700326.1 porin [Verrucomicrobiota bacterium]
MRSRYRVTVGMVAATVMVVVAGTAWGVESAPRVAHSSAFDAIKIGGRLMVDVALYDSDDVELSSGTEVRRGRIFVKGALNEDWFFKAQYEFTASGAGSVKDFYMGYKGLGDATTLLMGQFVEYGSLADTTSSKYTTFMERALPVLAFVPAERRIGVGIDTHGDAWYAGVGLFGENSEVDEEADDGVGASLRVTAAPILATERALHLGAWSAYRTPRGDETRLRARPESHVSDTRLIDTGVISNVNAQVSYGLELAGVAGPLSLQAEYLGMLLDREGFDDEYYAGWYTTLSWILTGETRPYDAHSGSFGRLRPLHPAGEGGVGAWEVAARFSTLDLDDGIPGGSEDNLTLGLNWYVNTHTRFMLNLIDASAERAGEESDVTIIQLRAQLDF